MLLLSSNSNSNNNINISGSHSLSAYARAEASLLCRKRSRAASVSSFPTAAQETPGFHSFGLTTLRHTMASAAMSASLAAAGMDRRNGGGSSTASSCASSLKTPGSGTFPSAMKSPSIYSPGFLKEPLKTPITPPSAYLDFLKTMSPALASPMATSTSLRFSFAEKPPLTKEASSRDSDTSQPALSRNTSYNSEASAASSSTTISEQSVVVTSAKPRTRPESPRIVIPPSTGTFAKPGPRSARTPRRLQIPLSPYSPAGNMNNTTGASHSPYSSTPLSAAPWSASFSPREATDPEITGKPGRVSVRHVVTRTVTYCRTPLEPAPRGKRRKLEDGSSSISISSGEHKIAEISSIDKGEATNAMDTLPAIVKTEPEHHDIPIAPELLASS